MTRNIYNCNNCEYRNTEDCSTPPNTEEEKEHGCFEHSELDEIYNK